MTTAETYDTMRNAARQAFDDAGLSYAVLSKESMQRLRTGGEF